MNRSRIISKLLVGFIVLFFGVALYLRVCLPYDMVFSGEWIKFTGFDPWYHMRIVDNLANNFPNLNSFDPYRIYPTGEWMGGYYFFDYLLAGIIWLIGLGSPTQHTIDVVGAYFPAVLGALTVIPVFFIGKELFNRWAGVISAGLIALFPSEFLGRSILGFTDHHVAETLFTTLAILFLILAVKISRSRQISFHHIKRQEWAVVAKPATYSLIAGVFMGIYLLTWAGALLFVFIIFLYFILQFIVDHLNGRSTGYLSLISTITFTIALLIVLPASTDKLSLGSLSIAIFTPIVLAILSHFMMSRGIKAILYPVAVMALGLASLVIFRITDPLLFSKMVGKIRGFFSWPVETTVLEMQPLFFPDGDFSLWPAWGNFTTGFYLSFISLGIIIYFIGKRGEPDKTLLVVWSLVMLAATLAMRRFAYYFVVNVALLTGFLSWEILKVAGFRELITKPMEVSARLKRPKVKPKKSQIRGFRLTQRHIIMVLGVIVVFFLVFFPNISPAVATARLAVFTPSDGWCESLSWLRDNTPEPFGDPDFYYELYEPPATGEGYNYPATAYSVIARWDYGYWITRLGRRIPTANPGTGHKGEARIFTAQDEASVNKMMGSFGARYVIVDHETATYGFHHVATLSGSRPDEFYATYYQLQEGELRPITLFYPEYYRSLVVRLYNFDGSGVVPQECLVISYQEKVGRDGKTYRQISGAQFFLSYEEAEAYLSSQEEDNYRIVGTNPFISPVPLDALEHYRLVHSSDSLILQPNVGMIPEVKIFEYKPPPLPIVQTLKARKIGGTSATAYGELSGLGTAAEVIVSFLWGRTEACDEGETPTQVMTLPERFACDLSGLLPNTTYYYKAKAVGDGTSYGEVESFRTKRQASSK